MKRILTALALTAPLLVSTGVSADDSTLFVLDESQLNDVNAGAAFATATSIAGAAGSFFSFTDGTTVTIAVSIGGASGSFSSGTSTSIAF